MAFSCDLLIFAFFGKGDSMPTGTLTLALRVVGEYPTLVAFRYYIQGKMAKTAPGGWRGTLAQSGTNLVEFQIFIQDCLADTNSLQ